MRFIYTGGEWISAEASNPIGEAIGGGINWAGEKSAEFFAEMMAEFMKGFGQWLVSVAPELFMTMAMIMCMGAIIGSSKAGKWAGISMVLAITFQVLRGAGLG